MRGWRSKILLGLILYSAGFATAVYALVPPGDKAKKTVWTAGRIDRRNKASSKSDKFVNMVGVGTHKCVSFAEEKAVMMSEFIKTELAERRKRNEK